MSHPYPAFSGSVYARGSNHSGQRSISNPQDSYGSQRAWAYGWSSSARHSGRYDPYPKQYRAISGTSHPDAVRAGPSSRPIQSPGVAINTGNTRGWSGPETSIHVEAKPIISDTVDYDQQQAERSPEAPSIIPSPLPPKSESPELPLAMLASAGQGIEDEEEVDMDIDSEDEITFVGMRVPDITEPRGQERVMDRGSGDEASVVPKREPMADSRDGRAVSMLPSERRDQPDTLDGRREEGQAGTEDGHHEEVQAQVPSGPSPQEGTIAMGLEETLECWVALLSRDPSRQKARAIQIIGRADKRVLLKRARCPACRSGKNKRAEDTGVPDLPCVVAPGNHACAPCVRDGRICRRKDEEPKAAQSGRSRNSKTGRHKAGRQLQTWTHGQLPGRAISALDQQYLRELFIVDRDASIQPLACWPSASRVEKSIVQAVAILTGDDRCVRCIQAGYLLCAQIAPGRMCVGCYAYKNRAGCSSLGVKPSQNQILGETERKAVVLYEEEGDLSSDSDEALSDIDPEAEAQQSEYSRGRQDDHAGFTTEDPEEQEEPMAVRQASGSGSSSAHGRESGIGGAEGDARLPTNNHGAHWQEVLPDTTGRIGGLVVETVEAGLSAPETSMRSPPNESTSVRAPSTSALSQNNEVGHESAVAHRQVSSSAHTMLDDNRQAVLALLEAMQCDCEGLTGILEIPAVQKSLQKINRFNMLSGTLKRGITRGLQDIAEGVTESGGVADLMGMVSEALETTGAILRNRSVREELEKKWMMQDTEETFSKLQQNFEALKGILL